MSSPDTQDDLLARRNTAEKSLALRPAREYEFLVTTEQPHHAKGTERQRIRQKVMRNFFEVQKAGPLATTSETSSVSTAQAQTKLKSRFRLSKTGQDSTIPQKTGTSHKTARKSEGKKTARAAGKAQTSKKTLCTKREVGSDTTSFRSLSPPEKSAYLPNITTEVVPTPSPFSLDAHLMDPFDALPVANTVKLELLFQLYKSGTKLNSVVIDCTNTWWPFVASDPGLLHATLASWALYGVLMRGVTSVVPEMLGHKTEAIKEINAKINSSNGWISDELVGNVLILATFENLYGEYDSALLHFGALKRMVDVRGGLDTFNHNCGLARGVVWVDFHTAIALRRPPVLPLVLDGPEPPPLPQTLLEEATNNSSLSLLQLPVSPIECFNIFQTMHLLALATTSRYVDEVDRLTYSNMLYELEFFILSTIDYSLDMTALVQNRLRITYDQKSPESEASDNDYARKTHDETTAAIITEAVLTSAQIFICAAMRDIPPSTKLYTILLQRLRGAIEWPGVSIINTWKEVKNLHILLWALVVGACVAPRSKREWWTERIGQVMREMGVCTLGALEGVLTEVAWTDYTFADALRGVWAQVDEVVHFKRI
ncbi:hypothetical protein DM02DRAFT_331986 [Periconia macrospinosa]|uniref:Tachykinin family protein n=1 Tax=Periconia macrospinosa TaxID=97972 RepID=A0A2V1DX68_9PLEO|nr:hypothetical protein DM02DRAFT_331986 [Periconia macrospinosa]